MKKALKLFRPADLFLYSILIAVALQVYSVMAFEGRGEASVVVERDGELIGRYALKEDRHIKLEAFNPAIILAIENKGVMVHKVDCSAQLCKRVGRISRQGESIACVPNKLLIYIERKAGEQGPPRIIIG